jgi:hypothetical protein
MATLTTVGPNPLNPAEQSTAVVTMPDEVMGAVVQAICYQYNYQFYLPNPDYDVENLESPETIPNPEGPGSFALRMTITNFWAEIVKSYRIETGTAALKAEVTQDMIPLLESIQISA